MTSTALPKAYLWRRLHSLSGFFLVLFLCEHLLTNSEAALFIGEDGKGFVRMVNFIHSLPYLPMIEIFLLGFPIAVHALYGIQYLRTAEPNSMSGQGKKPEFSYPRNRAYTWQRITSWIAAFVAEGHRRASDFKTLWSSNACWAR